MIKKVLWSVSALVIVVGLLLIALPTLLHKAGLHPLYSGSATELPGKRALIVTTSHAVLAAPGETEGLATGVFGSELTHPYYSFTDAGMAVDVASIRGGPIPIDPQSFYYMIKTPEDDRYLEDPVLQAKVANSIPIAEVDVSQYDIVFLSGGWGAAYDLAQSPELDLAVLNASSSASSPALYCRSSVSRCRPARSNTVLDQPLCS